MNWNGYIQNRGNKMTEMKHRLCRVALPALFAGILFALGAVPAGASTIGNASPNPVRLDASTTTTRITVRAPSDGAAFNTEILILDMAGREVIRKSRTENLTTEYTYDWDARNSAGRMVKSGVYIVYVWRRYQDVSRGEDRERFRIGVIRDGV